MTPATGSVVRFRPEDPRERHERGAERAAVAPAWWRRYGWALGGAALCVLLRLPFVGDPLSPDESGYGIVATHWQPGRHLYGPYWVDRPPMLLTLFRLGAWDSPYGLRVLGMVAAAAAVLAIGVLADLLAGERAQRWSSAVAACAFASPVVGSLVVDGELLAAPFVAASLLASVQAVRAEGNRSRILAAAGGVSAALAVLVKQNMIDGAVFLVVVLGLLLLRGVSPRRILGLGAAWVLGAAAGVVTVLTWAAWHGSRPGAVWYAMYPFLFEKADPVQSAHLHAKLLGLARLGELELLTLTPFFVVALVVLLVARRRQLRTVIPAGTALLAVVAYDIVSVAAGGDYWTHYLAQLVVPTSLAVGIVAARLGSGWSRLALASCVVLLVAWAGAVGSSRQTPGTTIGDALARVAVPHDTIVSAFGDADVVASSGMTSPYPYLWSLPARTLDPAYGTLAHLLEGRARPTWVVVRGPETDHELRASRAGPVLAAHYHRVAVLCDRAVLLRDDVSRPVPTVAPGQTCSG
jgi:hypothetical protein